MLIELAINKVKSIMSRRGYSFFEKGDYNLNLIGVRSDIKVANKFADTFLCIFKESGNWVLREWK